MSSERIADEKKAVKPVVQAKTGASKRLAGPAATIPARGPLNANRVLTLQSLVGNAAVQRFLDSSATVPPVQLDTDEELEEE